MEKLQSRDRERDKEEHRKNVLALKDPNLKRRLKYYKRIKNKPDTKSVRNKKLKHILKSQTSKAERAAAKAARAELLLLEDPG